VTVAARVRARLISVAEAGDEAEEEGSTLEDRLEEG
jgi:hypothetical protein